MAIAIDRVSFTSSQSSRSPAQIEGYRYHHQSNDSIEMDIYYPDKDNGEKIAKARVPLLKVSKGKEK